MKFMQNALVILAGGKGERFGKKLPKQFYKLGNKTILDIFLSSLDASPFQFIVLSVDKKYRKEIKNSSNYKLYEKKFIFSNPGKTRQQSSYNALIKIEKYKIKNVLIHDSARPLCSNKLMRKILSKLKIHKTSIPYVEYSDRQIAKFNKKDTKVLNIQTPQGFDYNLIRNAHKKFKNHTFNDDSSLIQKLNLKINLIKGEKANIKITYPEDIDYLKNLIKINMRSGIGYDIHKIDKNTKLGLKLCGVKIPFSKLIGHSDADVGLHAICDSIFGALSMRDIGYYFPNTDIRWKKANSAKFINFCRKKLSENNYKITNLDINIIAERPKISKYVNRMKKTIAELLKINRNIISIKATTNEKIGFIGNGEGIAAEAIVQISNENFN